MLKLYNKSTAMQRFLAFLVDGIILSIFAIGFSFLIFLIIGFDFGSYQAVKNEFANNYLLYFAYGGSYKQSYELALNEYTKLSIVFYLIVDPMYLIGVILYLVILPKYWKKQTVGRMLLKIKVIGHSGDIEPGAKRTIIREVLGTWLCYVVIYSLVSVIVIIISALMILISGRGIVDRISGTDMVQESPVSVDPNTFNQPNRFDQDVPNQFRPNPNEFRKDDSIDAEVHDLNENNDSDIDNNSNNSNNDSDDEYQIF